MESSWSMLSRDWHWLYAIVESGKTKMWKILSALGTSMSDTHIFVLSNDSSWGNLLRQHSSFHSIIVFLDLNFEIARFWKFRWDLGNPSTRIRASPLAAKPSPKRIWDVSDVWPPPATRPKALFGPAQPNTVSAPWAHPVTQGTLRGRQIERKPVSRVAGPIRQRRRSRTCRLPLANAI
jgi:hypothetical protein